MWPILGGLISGASSLLGSFFSNDQSADNTAANIHAQQLAQQQTQAFNAEQAALNREFSADQAEIARNVQMGFQQQMSSTAYQRARQDMQAAGLNPILAAGGPASTPSGSGAMGSGSTASVGTPNMALHNTRHAFEGLGDAVSKVVSSAVQVKTFEKMTDEIANIQADTAKAKASEALIQQQQKTEEKETHRRAAEAQKSEYDVLPKHLSATEAQAILNMPKWLRDVLVQGSYSGGKVASTLEAVPMLGSSAKNIRSLFPSRSTTERTTTDTRGHGSSTFEERFRGGGF